MWGVGCGAVTRPQMRGRSTAARAQEEQDTGTQYTGEVTEGRGEDRG